MKKLQFKKENKNKKQEKKIRKYENSSNQSLNTYSIQIEWDCFYL